MAGAFTAGVKPGGLTDGMQIRILLCYLVKSAGPLPRDIIEGALLQEELVNYFELGDAFAELEKQALLYRDEQERYAITEKGLSVADALAYDLPRSVRESAIRAVIGIQSWLHKAAMNRAHVEEQDGHYTVHCAIGEMGSDVLQLNVVMPDALTADVVKNRFISHGSEIYRALLNQLTEPAAEGDTPPEALR